MEKRIAIAKNAQSSLFTIGSYIAKGGYPETAEKFINRLYEFINTLSSFPEKFSLCRFEKYFKKGYRCAVVHTNFMVIYKVHKTKVSIIYVIHTSQMY